MSRAMVAVGQNPSIQVSKAPIEPPPIPSTGDKWVKRVYPQLFSISAGSSVVDVTVPSTVVGGFLDKVQVWGLDNTRMSVNFKTGNCTDLGTDDVSASDYSSQAQLPGITFKVPLGHAKAISATTSPVISVDQRTDAQTVVIHYHAFVKI